MSVSVDNPPTSTMCSNAVPFDAAKGPVPPAHPGSSGDLGRAAVAHAYLELLRPANVVTATADVLAGSFVAGAGVSAALPWLLAATGCLYAGGAVLNDFFDRAVDAVERPERPLPSGRVRASAAAWLGSALLIVGILAGQRAGGAAGNVALAIAALVVLYDGWAKSRRWIGPVNMGLCRAFNFLLGIAAVPAALAASWPLALLSFTYICAVTALSRGEVHGAARTVAAFVFGALVAVALLLSTLTLSAAHRSPVGAALALLFAYRVLPPFWRAYRDPRPARIRNAIKIGVLSLVLLDAVLAAAYGGVFASALVLATALLAGALARLFAVT